MLEIRSDLLEQRLGSSPRRDEYTAGGRLKGHALPVLTDIEALLELLGLHIDHVNVVIVPASGVDQQFSIGHDDHLHRQIAWQLDVASGGRDSPAVGQRGAALAVDVIRQQVLALLLGFIGDESGGCDKS